MAKEKSWQEVGKLTSRRAGHGISGVTFEKIVKSCLNETQRRKVIDSDIEIDNDIEPFVPEEFETSS